jgi:hypothetical protein
MRATALGAFAAILVQPLFALAWSFLPAVLHGEAVRSSDLLSMVGWVTLVAAFAVLILGVPAFLVLLRVRAFSIRWVGVLGSTLGALPVALLGWPTGGDSGSSASVSWHGRLVPTMVDGVTTLEGWLMHLEGVLLFGTHGLLGALAFGWAWRKCQPSAEAPAAPAR